MTWRCRCWTRSWRRVSDVGVRGRARRSGIPARDFAVRLTVGPTQRDLAAHPRLVVLRAGGGNTVKVRLLSSAPFSRTPGGLTHGGFESPCAVSQSMPPEHVAQTLPL